MGRIALIILLLFPTQLFAGRYLFLLHQREQTFTADGNVWASFFKKKYPDLKIIYLKEYTAPECGGIVKKLGEDLSFKDTLIMVIAAHTIDKMGATILKMVNNEVDFDNGIITSYTYKYWLTYLNEKRIRILVFLLTCQSEDIIPFELAKRLSYVTIVYGSDKGYTLFKSGVGSIISACFSENDLPDISSYIVCLTHEWKNKKYYQGSDMNNGWKIMDYYPMKPVMVGNNFYF